MFYFVFGMMIIILLPSYYYVGLRFLQTLSYYLPSLNVYCYWIVFVVLSNSFVFARVFGRVLPAVTNTILNAFGYLWMAAMLYLFCVFFAIDISSYLIKLTKFSVSIDMIHGVRLIAVFVVIMLFAYGTWNARTPRVSRYDIDIPKTAGEFKQLKIVMISDLHLGKIIGNTRLRDTIKKVNALEPDLVLMPGDIIQDFKCFLDNDMASELQTLTPPMGVFASLGNHEFYGAMTEDAVSLLELGNLKVLQDSYVKVADSFYIVGKNDPAAKRRSDARHLDIDEIMEGIDRSLPVILLSHQPTDLEAAQKAGVDLQLSGHTHGGQLFPANLLTGLLFEEDWGYLRKDSLQLIVTCGLGNWGPDMRIGSKSEIVEILINFR